MMEEKVLAEKEQEGLEDLNKNDKLNKKFEEEAEKNPQMDDAVREFIELRQRGPKDDSTVAHIAFELAQFKAAIKIILRGWVRTPKALWHVFTSEVQRLYRVWVGLPVGPRWWSIRLPNLNVLRDEL